jgi:endonuclease-3
MAKLSVRHIDTLIRASSFHEGKAAQIREIARRIVDEFGGELPCDFDVLTSFRGVGPKCANLAMGVACGAERISVDIHVHRVTNRWGYVATTTPESTMVVLEGKLPKKYWIEINRLLVPFVKPICTGHLLNCSTCPVLEYCRRSESLGTADGRRSAVGIHDAATLGPVAGVALAERKLPADRVRVMRDASWPPRRIIGRSTR